VAAEQQERVEEDLVAAVPEDELLGLDPVPRGERRKQIGGGTGVAVQQDALELGVAHVPRRGIRLRPLIGLEPDLGVHLLRAVRREAREVGARRREDLFGHPRSSIDDAWKGMPS
jgi:hypothetical protein